MKHVDILMRQAVSDNVFPGAALLVSKEDSILFFEAYGKANVFSQVPMTRDTMLDLASLTKPLSTTLAIMKLVQKGLLSLEQNLGCLLPGFEDTDKKAVNIINLLVHNSGLPDYRPYYKKLCGLPFIDRKKALYNMLLRESMVYATGRKVIYSDIGFMILRQVVEYLSEKPLDVFVYDEIYRPLGLEDLFYVTLSSSSPKKVFAATEVCEWRGTLVEGVVHDENSYVMGGVEGHSGLFGTADNIFRLLYELLQNFYLKPGSGVFDTNLVSFFLKSHKGSPRAVGFDTPSAVNSSSGSLFSKKSVGHLGFTGTSFWMDLENSIIVVLLTNRVHPSRANIRIRAFRPVLHDAVMKNI